MEIYVTILIVLKRECFRCVYEREVRMKDNDLTISGYLIEERMEYV